MSLLKIILDLKLKARGFHFHLNKTKLAKLLQLQRTLVKIQPLPDPLPLFSSIHFRFLFQPISKVKKIYFQDGLELSMKHLFFNSRFIMSNVFKEGGESQVFLGKEMYFNNQASQHPITFPHVSQAQVRPRTQHGKRRHLGDQGRLRPLLSPPMLGPPTSPFLMKWFFARRY